MLLRCPNRRCLLHTLSPAHTKRFRYVHTKFLLIDPLSDDPTVVSGSANFSLASTTSNDENMIVVRGPSARRMARIFLVEFLRVHGHFAYRETVNARASGAGRTGAAAGTPASARASGGASGGSSAGVASASTPLASTSLAAAAGHASEGDHLKLQQANLRKSLRDSWHVGEQAEEGDHTDADAKGAPAWVKPHFKEGSKQQRERRLFAQQGSVGVGGLALLE